MSAALSTCSKNQTQILGTSVRESRKEHEYYYLPWEACEFVFKLSWVCFFEQQVTLIYLFVSLCKHPE